MATWRLECSEAKVVVRRATELHGAHLEKKDGLVGELLRALEALGEEHHLSSRGASRGQTSSQEQRDLRSEMIGVTCAMSGLSGSTIATERNSERRLLGRVARPA